MKGKDPDISSFRALYQSFYDAPGGYKKELHEIIHKVGGEVRLNYENMLYIAIRLGRYMMHETKGNMKYNTQGIGIGVYGFTLDIKRMGANYKPIDETFGYTLGFRCNLDGELFRF